MIRAIMTAYTMTGDKDTLRTVLRYFKFLREELRRSPLSGEDSLHTADTIEAGILFYNITGQKAVLPVLNLILSQSYPYTQLFHAFPYRLPVHRMVSEEDLLNGVRMEPEDGYHRQLLHTADGANLCEGLRASGLSGILSGSGKDISAPEAGLTHMNKAHGTAAGAIASDPLLSGRHPSRGVSAKAISELMASLETLMTCPDPFSVGDQWETAFYNAALACFSPDLSMVQPVQQTNQAEISKRSRHPLLSDEAGLWGLRDADSVASLLPVIPRFLRCQWMLSSDGGIASMGYAPCRVQAHIGKCLLRLDVSGDYPSDGNITVRLSLDQPGAFPIHLRVPSWAHDASAVVNGETYAAGESEFLTISREWHDGDIIQISLPMQVALIPCYHRAVSVGRGPLRFVYAPPVRLDRNDDGSDALRMEGAAVTLLKDAEMEPVREGTRLSLRTRVSPLPEWRVVCGSLEQPPIDLPEDARGRAFETLLKPYADAPIRIAVLPLC